VILVGLSVPFPYSSLKELNGKLQKSEKLVQTALFITLIIIHTIIIINKNVNNCSSAIYK